jgi:hypothetical protein
MRPIFRVFSFSLYASLTFFWLPHASAQSSGAGACAAFAAKITPGPRQGILGATSISQQVMRSQLYFKCLQSHGQQPVSGANAAAKAGTFITFDVPGSTCLARFPVCTRPTGINPAGAITGVYLDANLLLHAFLRAPDGTFTKFDGPVPGDTEPVGINPAGVIAGSYCDAVTCHGFLRARDGTFTTFDPPGSAYVETRGINPDGAITGDYYDANGVGHGFLRARDGTFTTFDPQGSAYTQPNGINPAGAITGIYADANGSIHGFLWVRDGTFTTFDGPGSADTEPVSINPAGAITGSYSDANFVGHSFLRAPTVDAGTSFTTFDPPGAVGINPSGVITGLSAFHGFVRSHDGTVTAFDVPGSQYTWRVAGINPAGVIAGSYLTLDASAHCCLESGFIRRP